MRELPVWLAMVLLAACSCPRLAAAHLFAPALLEVREIEPGRADVRWKQPAVRIQGSRLRPVLPGDCTGVGRPEIERGTGGVVARWRIECPAGLVGKTIGVEGLATSQADALLRVTLQDGRSWQRVLTAERPAFVIEGSDSPGAVGSSYAMLGVEHIFGGWDHLLFVLGLVLLVRSRRILLWTISAFTVGHSVTLALAALGVVTVPQQPVEAAIALSIYLLAVELARVSRSGAGTVDGAETGYRKPGGRIADRLAFISAAPWLVAGGFGLLHGLGFAGALTEVGLPQGEIPLALFSFNIGIEIGQLMFVAVALGLIALLRAGSRSWPAWAPTIPAYAIGSLAIYWFVERLAVATGISG
jgi:hydrogenase/urease accessory protein HupE